MNTQHSGSKYLRTIHPADGNGTPIRVDVYSVLVAFGVTNPGIQHAVKKLLCAGLRGKNSEAKDLTESLDALRRAIEILGQTEVSEQPSMPICGTMQEAYSVAMSLTHQTGLRHDIVKQGEKWAVVRG